jgi:hypothetical protein
LRDGAVEQFQLLLVQPQFDDRVGHGHSLKLYTRIGSEIMFSDTPSARPMHHSQRMRGCRTRADHHYSHFLRLLEAQSLGDVLPNLRARRTKLPHPVYQIPNYRMRQSARSVR